MFDHFSPPPTLPPQPLTSWPVYCKSLLSASLALGLLPTGSQSDPVKIQVRSQHSSPHTFEGGVSEEKARSSQWWTRSHKVSALLSLISSPTSLSFIPPQAHCSLLSLCLMLPPDSTRLVCTLCSCPAAVF